MVNASKTAPLRDLLHDALRIIPRRQIVDPVCVALGYCQLTELYPGEAALRRKLIASLWVVAEIAEEAEHIELALRLRQLSEGFGRPDMRRSTQA